MRVCRDGVTRIVLLAGPWAIKLPRFGYGWRLGLQGLLGNHQEAMLWRETRSPKYCPVVLALPLALVIVMRRARPLVAAEWEWFRVHGWLAEVEASCCEAKADSFGVLDKRIVAVDYGS